MAEDTPPPTQLTVLAEESLAVPLPLIIRHYTTEHPISLNLSLDSTAHQVAKIEEGEPADIFITTSENALQQLKLQGMLDAYTYHSVAGNRMMLAVAAANPLDFTMEDDRELSEYLPSGPPPVFAMSDDDLHAEGIFAHDVLTALELNPAEEVMLPLPLTSPQPANVAILPDRRSVIDLIAQGSTYGIVYATEAHHASGIRQAALLPDTLHRPINYVAVVVAGKEMESARDFVKFLRSADVQEIFAANGFIPAEAAEATTPPRLHE